MHYVRVLSISIISFFIGFTVSFAENAQAPDVILQSSVEQSDEISALNKESEESIQNTPDANLRQDGEESLGVNTGSTADEQGQGGVVQEEDILLIDSASEESIIEIEVGTPSKPQEKPANGSEVPVEHETKIQAEPQSEEMYGTGIGNEEMPSSSFERAGTTDTVAPRKPAIIEKERSINFSRNLSEYRSPKTAMVMSLIIPGLGQAYVKRHVKTAIFGVAEAAIIGTAINFGLKGKDKKQSAYDFADRNFSADKFLNYYSGIRELLENTTTFNDTLIRDVQVQLIEYDTAAFSQGAREKTSSYYQSLEDKKKVQGWRDCEPVLNAERTGFILTDPSYKYSYESYQAAGSGDTVWLVNKISGRDTTKGVWGHSDLQLQYERMMDESNDKYRLSGNILFLLIANHLVSAIDAMISARAYNDELLGKQSFWQRINLDQQMALVDGSIRSTFGMRIKF